MRTNMTLTKAGEVSTLFDPPSQIPQPHLEPLKKAGEGQELAGEHPYPYDDYEAGARRR